MVSLNLWATELAPKTSSHWPMYIDNHHMPCMCKRSPMVVSLNTTGLGNIINVAGVIPVG